MMNTLKSFRPLSYLVLVFIITLIAGCSGFLDVNKDPNAATTPPGGYLFTEASATLQSNRNIEIGPVVSFFAQTFASNGSSGDHFIPQERYNLSPGAPTVTNNFGGIYTDVLNNLQLFIQNQQEQKEPRNNAIAQARLFRSYAYWYLTMLFGAVPYTEALNPNIDNPTFTPQQEILDSLVANINESIQLINIEDQSDAITTGDLWYKGNMVQWLKFANSLKLRILMELYNTDPSIASQITPLLSDTNLIRKDKNDFEFPYSDEPGSENQQFQLSRLYKEGIPYFFSAGKPLVDVMNAENDPRRRIYFDKAKATGTYVGVRAGTSNSDNADSFSTLGSAITIASFPGRVLTAAETLLFESEFLATQHNYSEARDKLEDGIRASINDFDGLPAGPISQTEEDAYVTRILNKYDAASNAGKLKIIQLQHYIDSFEKVPENWANWRRTKVPDLSVPYQAVFSSIIRRFPYSQDEISSNANAPAQPKLTKPMSYEKKQ